MDKKVIIDDIRFNLDRLIQSSRLVGKYEYMIKAIDMQCLDATDAENSKAKYSKEVVEIKKIILKLLSSLE